MITVNVTTILSLVVFLALGWLKSSHMIAVVVIIFIIVNVAGALGLRLRAK